MTVTRSQAGSIERIAAAWTSASDGSQTQTIGFSGTLLRVVTDPGATAPTDNYDLTAIDEFGVDLFDGVLVDRDTANSEDFCPGIAFSDGVTTSVMPKAHIGDITLTIANAGSAKVGTIVLFVKK